LNVKVPPALFKVCHMEFTRSDLYLLCMYIYACMRARAHIQGGAPWV